MTAPAGAAPAGAKPSPVRIVANLSAPRVGFTDPLVLAAQLVAMKIELRKASGAFWEQSLSRLLYQAVEENFDYVLTLDYDSVFRPSDVWYMLRLIEGRGDAAAVFPVQYRREADQLLVGLPGVADGQAPADAFAEHLVPATVGHFGLTLIRVAALRDLPHPWLWSQPGANGRWDAPDKIDADIWFWRRLRERGHRIYCATRCVIGHLQQMITWPGDDWQVVHQYAGKYFQDGDAPPAVIDAVRRRVAGEKG